MPISTIPTIPEDEVPSFNNNVNEKVTTYKLVKLYTSDGGDELSPHAYDLKKQDRNKSHVQLFFNTTDKTELSKCTPSYYREVYRVDDRIHNFYWYHEALRTVPSPSGSTMLWSIGKVKAKKSKISRRIRRPKFFSITNPELKSNSMFEYDGSENEPKGYSGEIITPRDHSCIQRFRWVRYKDGSGWAFIFRNDPSTALVEFRKTNFENEFEIVFLRKSPPGWGSEIKQDLDSTHSTTAQFMRYPSVFSNTRSSTTSGYLSNFSFNRESTFSDISNASSVNVDGERNSTISNVNNMSHRTHGNILSLIGSERHSTSLGNLVKFDSERCWHEYVLASTVAIQDEVNSDKRRLWKK